MSNSLSLRRILAVSIGYHPLGGILFNSLGHRSRGSDNTPPGSPAGEEGRSQPLFDQRHRSIRTCQRFLAGGFFDIAAALEVDPADLINASVFPDQLLKKK